MIAEDEPLERIALRRIVEREFPEINVTEDAVTGVEAIEKALMLRPDILIVDIKMPEKNGLDAQRQIIEFHPNIKTIMITAYDEFFYAHEAIQCNVCDLLLKPVPQCVLKNSIKKVLQAIKDSGNMMPLATTGSTSQESAINYVIQYINNNFNLPLRLADMARMAHLNEQYFSRYFKKETGMTFIKYVNWLKIKRAKTLLADTDVPLYFIASELGYSDSAYFSKVFFKYEQTTPLRYRKQMQS